jgi:hypothetical protein
MGYDTVKIITDCNDNEILIGRGIPMDRVSISQGQSEKLLRLQRDLGMALSTTSEQIEALNLILDATCRIEGIDCGGIYLFDKTTGDLNLMVHRGLSAEFVEKDSHYSPDSPQVQLVISAKPIYGLFSKEDFFSFSIPTETC